MPLPAACAARPAAPCCSAQPRSMPPPMAMPDGRIPATFEIICLTGWAAHDSQQKPLRPGSAQARLAEALNTAEQPLGNAPQGNGAVDG